MEIPAIARTCNHNDNGVSSATPILLLLETCACENGYVEKMAESTVRIREATMADGPAIARMHRRNGLGGDEVKATLRGCVGYPLLGEFNGPFPLGWVLDNDGEVVGSLGNIPQVYELGGKLIKAAIATAWAVDAGYRTKSIGLMMSFLRQPGVQLWLDGSASHTASQVLSGLKMARMPIPEYATPCFWAVNSRAFVAAALQRRQVPLAPLLAWPAGLLLGMRDWMRNSGRGGIVSEVRRAPWFDERWDALWERLRASPDRLRAVRTSAVLRWRFQAAMDAGTAVILTAERDGVLAGYAVLVRRSGEELGMSLYDVVDLQVQQDDPETIQDLVKAAVRAAREDGVAAVKIMTGIPAKRSPLISLRPYTYQLPFWQLYFKAGNELKDQLKDAGCWDFSLFETY